MQAVEDGLSRLFEIFFAWLPQLIGAVVILIIGGLIAGALAKATKKALARMRFDHRMHTNKGGKMLQKAVPHPAQLVAAIVYWVIMFGVISLAVAVLGIPALTALVAAIYSYLPNVLAALLIFLIAGAIAGGISTFARQTMGDTMTGRVVAAVGPVIVMSIATFMILDELGIAETIVTITYAALIGSAALGLALAFGLGGREVAATILKGTYQKTQDHKDEIKQDFKKGTEHAKDKAQDAAAKAKR